jgi:peptide/nickel transport system permease protein
MRRLLLQILRALGTLAGVWVFVQLLPRWLPEDPARVAAGEFATPADVEAMRQLLGLDHSWLQALGNSAAALLHGDLGQSLRYRKPVVHVLASGFPVSFRLALLAILGSAVLAWLLAARRTRFSRILQSAAVASPVYVLGPLLLWAIAQHVPGLPVAGVQGWTSWILPTVALSVPLAGHQARVLGSILDTLRGSLGPRCWEACGVPTSIRWGRWLFPAVSGPWLTILGLQLGGLLGGAVLVETIFALPGLGQTLVNALASRDLPLVQGAVTLAATLYVAAQLGVETVQSWVDPRAR